MRGVIEHWPYFAFWGLVVLVGVGVVVWYLHGIHELLREMSALLRRGF